MLSNVRQFLAIIMLSYVRRWVKLTPLESPKIGSSRITFLSILISKNILLIGEAKVSKFKFMHTLCDSKSILTIEQKAIVSCFVKHFAFFL